MPSSPVFCPCCFSANTRQSSRREPYHYCLNPGCRIKAFYEKGVEKVA